MKKPKPPKSIAIPHRGHYQAMNWSVELPLDHDCQIYPRVSTPEQMQNVSAEMQKDKAFALRCGWREDQIIVDDRDLGVSGQLRMEDRIAFNEMLRRIAGGLIKAVVVWNIDRLFRNRWGDESGKFMEICHTHGVVVVTPDFVYDFRISWHIDRFKRRCEEAWNYLEYHVYGRMIAARDERARRGYWSGGSLPAGYILDLEEKLSNGQPNPRFLHYIPYEPHAEVVRWIFWRFRELNGNLKALMREINTKPYLFPDFGPDMHMFRGKLQHTKVEGGYTITTIPGLRRLLTNRAYIGYWVYKGEVVSTNNHEAIVDPALFAYAYNRLSAMELDGTPNQRLIERRKKYAKRHDAERPAILKDIIRTDDPKVSIYTRNTKYKNRIFTYYGFCPEMEGKDRSRAICCVDAAGLDMIVLNRLRERLRSPQAEVDFQDFRKFESKTTREAEEELGLIKREIESTKANMARILEQIKAGQLTNPDLVQVANESYNAAKEELKRLEHRQKTLEQICKMRETSETLKDIELQIEATKAHMARILEQIKSGRLTNPDLAQAANESYTAAQQELKRLEQRKTETTRIAQEDEERRTYRDLMREVDEAWEEIVLPEEYPRLVYMFVRSVTLGRVSPSFCSVRIEWKDPTWEADEGLIFKGPSASPKWEPEEIAILEKYYPTASWEELAELLPRRSRQAMFDYYQHRKIENPRRALGLPLLRNDPNGMPYNICLEDWKVMKAYGISVEAWKKFEGATLIRWSNGQGYYAHSE
ncbi:MAG: recombinase family protein [Thermogemmatispora sp.]|uniref:recombinase family protein n=2 Tax=Thermogemmatispora sp. TaxID=1968838 RepID=UPI001DCC6F07|nr:recombinase family protein [Thermogemmatispora sp.]MBX5449698.1 recombinase family protein [Thermogemmatispora sp.]